MASERRSLGGEVTWKEIEGFCEPSERVLLKIDIEGSEYDVLPDVLAGRANVVCIVVEFHDLGSRWSDFVDIVTSLSSRFLIVHTHANNWGGIVPDTDVPEVVEITFLALSLLQANEHLGHARTRYPLCMLDSPNNRDRPDLDLRFDLLD